MTDLLRYRLRLIAIFAVLMLIGILAWSWHQGGIVYQLLRGDLTATGKIEKLREFIARFGPLGGFVYFVAVVVEVLVAPLPGALLYAPGGMLFGGFLGGLITLLGNTVGAGLAWAIARGFTGKDGIQWSENSRMDRLQAAIAGKGVWVILALRINPLTSSDLVSYAAGCTNIRLRSVVLGTFLGMAPLCFLQAYFAHKLLAEFPALLYPAIGLCVIYLAVGVWLVARRRSA